MRKLPKTATTVAVDTETSGLYPDEGAFVASVAVAWRGGSAAYPFWHEEGGDKANLGIAEWRQLLDELLERRLVFHNANFDLAMLAAGIPTCPGTDLTDNLAWDTMLASRILAPTESASLDSCAQRAGLSGKQGLDAVLGWLKEHKLKKYRYDLAPWNIVRDYVKTDAELTWVLYECQTYEATKTLESEIQREIALAKVLTKMELRGIGYDVAQSRAIAQQLTERADKIEAGMPFGCGINEAKAYFFDERGLTPARTSEKTDKPSLDKEQIRDWAIEGVEWAQEYKEVVWARRAVSRWYLGYADKCGFDGRLRVRYRQGSVVSGRLSAERINLQAMPLGDKIEGAVPGPRDLLKPRTGYELWSLDMSQAELRIGAKYARCQQMIDLLEDGVDWHAVTTEKLLGVDPSHPEWKERRTIGKKLNFASLYGIGPESFQRLLAREAGIHLSMSECDRIVGGWRSLWWEFPRAAARAAKAFEERGWVRILMDSEHETRSYKQQLDWKKDGFNRMVQGSLAGWMRLWLVEIERLFPGTLVLTVHDSAVLELRRADARRIVDHVIINGRERASKIFGINMPIDAEKLV